MAYIIEHPFHAPTINDTHYVRNRRFGRNVRVVRMPFPGGVQGGVPPFIDARPIDNPDKLAGKDSIERERDSSFPIEQTGLRFDEIKEEKRGK